MPLSIAEPPRLQFGTLNVLQLLASPTFHRSVRRVHKKVQEIRYGEKLHDPSDLGGGTQIDSEFDCFLLADCVTNLDMGADPDGGGAQKFLRYFIEEIKDQFRGIKK